MDNLTKNAGFIEGFLKGAIGKVDFKNKPFETIFSIMGPVALWRLLGWKGKIIYAAMEMFGFGPGLIGQIIDNTLKGNGANTIEEMDLSDSNLQQAAKAVESKIAMPQVLKKLWDKVSLSHLEDIYMIKKSINSNDLVTATYVSKYFTKEAKPGGIPLKPGGFLSKVFKQERLSLISAIFGLLKMFVKGLILLGVIGGVKSVIKGDDKEEQILTDKRISGAARYKNEKNNVQETLINLLNTISFPKGNFETVFKDKHNVPLRNSKQMRNLLMEIRLMNDGKPIYLMDGWDIFFAPSLKEMATILMPNFAYNKTKDEISNLIKEL